MPNQIKNMKTTILLLLLTCLLSIDRIGSSQKTVSAEISTCLKTGGYCFSEWDEWGTYWCSKDGWMEATVTDCGYCHNAKCEMETACKTPGQSAGVCNGKTFLSPPPE